MTLFWKDWLELKKAVMRAIFNHDIRFKRISFEQALPYLRTEFDRMTIPELEKTVEKYGIHTDKQKD